VIQIEKNHPSDEIVIKFIPIDMGILEKIKIIFKLIFGNRVICVETFKCVSVREKFLDPIESLIGENPRKRNLSEFQKKERSKAATRKYYLKNKESFVERNRKYRDKKDSEAVA